MIRAFESEEEALAHYLLAALPHVLLHSPMAGVLIEQAAFCCCQNFCRTTILFQKVANLDDVIAYLEYALVDLDEQRPHAGAKVRSAIANLLERDLMCSSEYDVRESHYRN